MLLQTLAENGVKHGITGLPAGGELAIVTQALTETCASKITNMGNLSDATEGTSAVGLDARERLRLMWRRQRVAYAVCCRRTKIRAEVVIPLRLTVCHLERLIIDDERLARSALRRLLSAHPEVTSSAKLRTQTAICAIHKTSPDVLFLDVEMPGGSGFDLPGKSRGCARCGSSRPPTMNMQCGLFEVSALDYW